MNSAINASLLAHVCDANETDHDDAPLTAGPCEIVIEAPATELPVVNPRTIEREHKAAMAAWAQLLYESNNLPSDASLTHLGKGKFSVTCKGGTAIFFSKMLPVAPKIIAKPKPVVETAPTADAKPAPVNDGSRTCRDCPNVFVPASPKFVVCPACHAKWLAEKYGITAKPAKPQIPDGMRVCRSCPAVFTPAQPHYRDCPECHAKAHPMMPPKPLTPEQRKAKAMEHILTERRAKEAFRQEVMTRFEACEDLTQSGFKVWILGAQVSVSKEGNCANFQSERLRKQIVLEKEEAARKATEQRRADEAAALLRRQAEAKARADAANNPDADKKSKKGKKGDADAKSTKGKGRSQQARA